MLSPREREVLALLARGFTNAEIARRLILAEATVRLHLKNARRRLGAQTRAHAAILALSRGEITLDRNGGGASADKA